MAIPDRTAFSNPNYQYPVSSNTTRDMWELHSPRIQAYMRYRRFYEGQHWTYSSQTGEPVTTVNYVERFVDMHAGYLFGDGVTVYCNRKDFDNPAAADLLNENLEDNGLLVLDEMATEGGITGDCWVKVGYDESPIYGDRVKYSVIPSQYVIPIFDYGSQLTPSAVLIRWNDTKVVSNTNYGKSSQVRSVVRGEYWTKDKVVFLEDDEPVSEKINLLGEIPLVHIKNQTRGASNYWGRADIASIIELQREFNEKMTDVSDIINYHAAPVTLIYGAKASALQKGARKVWSGLPVTARVENLQLNGDLGAATNYLGMLKETIFQLGSVTSAAFGGSESISNTSGVALSLQFAPIVQHNARRQKTYGAGFVQINYLTLLMYQILGRYSPPKKNPYFSYTKFPDPLPRDKDLELNRLTQMKNALVLGRSQVLRQLIANGTAPTHISDNEVQQVLDQALEEELRVTELMAKANMAGTPPPPGESPMSSPAAAEKRSQQAELDAAAQTAA